jgi:hypothetical protein
MRSETEAYRFTWRSSFHGDAVVRIGRQGDQITLRWFYRWFRRVSRDDAPPVVSLSLEDWGHLQYALIAASFWALDTEEDPLMRGLDRAFWTIEGRTDIFRAISRWSPREAGMYGLGRLFFELAGRPLAELEIY